MITAKKAANAVAGRTVRACDGCLQKRAQWYCAADDAFLCQGCDSLVHSANLLASRHERVRLEKTTAPPKAAFGSATIENSPPAWHRGFTRKARTPRGHAKAVLRVKNPHPVVPDIGSEEASPEENEEQLLYQVPVFDPFDAELCRANEVEKVLGDESESVLVREKGHDDACDELENFHGFLPSDMDLAEFAADVESLLGTGLNDNSCGIEGLGLLDCKEDDEMDKFSQGRIVKVEYHEDAFQMDAGFEFGRETMDWEFSYESPVTGEEEEKVVAAVAVSGGCKVEVKREMFLRLNHEAVISAWDGQGCPWTTGVRPEVKPGEGWPDFTGWVGLTGYSHPCGGAAGGGDGGREARVSRYREKRRTRLFSKKIRYEVRKLNAEKRPRMKGRFVKRSSFVGVGPPPPPPHNAFPCM